MGSCKRCGGGNVRGETDISRSRPHNTSQTTLQPSLLHTIMISLPKLVLGHVVIKKLSPHTPLPARSTNRIVTALEGRFAWCTEHGDPPSTTRRLGFRSVVKAKYKGKGQW